MFKIIETQKYPVVAIFLGFILILLGVADIQELQKMKLIYRSSLIYPLIILGSVFVIFSFIAFLAGKASIGWFAFSLVKKCDKGFYIKIGGTRLNIIFGRIEQVANEFPESTIVMPANEFFDDECIDDSKSALGAYVNSRFSNQVDDVKDRIRNELMNHDKVKVEKEQGSFKYSYGVGKAILLEKILGSTQPVVFLAVTTKRAGEGLRSELSHIHDALKELFAVTADARVESVCLPILGSGHGGLKKEIALFGLLMALLERITSPSGKHIKTVNIIVFRDNEKSKPEVKEATVKKLLSLSAGILLK